MTWKPRRVFIPFQFQYKEKRKQEEKTMDAKTYQECALRTMADQQKILDRLIELGPLAMQLDNGARGLADDAGEVSGVIKKHIEYGQPLDVEHLIEELGDCFWRMLQICKAAGITFEQIWQANYDKLNKVRYKDGYSDDAAKEENRDREKERQVMAKNPSGVINEMDVAEAERLEQNGQGWAEPNANYDSLPPVVQVEVDEDRIEIVKTFEEHPKTVVKKKPLNHSYTRYCKICELQPVHKTNLIQICTQCFMTHGEVKELTYDTATTG